ncbi:MAG: hypothetical protein ABEI52_02685 [Halobacteriaceae archaeon]
MSTKVSQTDDKQTETVEIEYGDQFRHIITGEVVTVHDARDGCEKVLFHEGGFEYRENLVAAITGNGNTLWEVEARGRACWEGEAYRNH